MWPMMFAYFVCDNAECYVVLIIQVVVYVHPWGFRHYGQFAVVYAIYNLVGFLLRERNKWNVGPYWLTVLLYCYFCCVVVKWSPMKSVYGIEYCLTVVKLWAERVMCVITAVSVEELRQARCQRDVSQCDDASSHSTHSTHELDDSDSELPQRKVHQTCVVSLCPLSLVLEVNHEH